MGQVTEGIRKVVEVVQEKDLTSTITDKLTLRIRKHHFVNSTLRLTVSTLRLINLLVWTLEKPINLFLYSQITNLKKKKKIV